MKKELLCGILCSGMLITATVAAAAGQDWKYGLNGASGFNEKTYATIPRQTEGKTNSEWRNGSMTGNGEMALIEGFDPAEDVIIFNNTKLVLGSNDIFDAADVSSKIDEIRESAAKRENPNRWIGWVKDFWQVKYGIGDRESASTKSYHPAAQLRIKNNTYTSNDSYNRYTNFETGEIGMQWKKGSAEYNTRTFISRADGVAVTIIEAPQGETLDLTMSVDNMLEMGFDSPSFKEKGIEIRPETREIVKKDGNGYSLGQIAKYGDFNMAGYDTNPDAHGAKGGYATAIRLITEDGAVITETEDVHTISPNTKFNADDPTQAFEVTVTTPKLNIKGTNSIVLVSKVDVQLTGLYSLDDVETLYDSLLADVDNVVSAKSNGITSDGETASVSVSNTTDIQKEYMLVSASYSDDGSLSGIEIDKKTVKQGESAELSVAKKDRVFLWDENQTPFTGTGETDNISLYESILEPHKVLHGGMYEGTELELCITDEEKADRELTNTELNRKQRDTKDKVNKAWLERLYNNGRFGLICASGYNTTRLGGIWIGNWMPDWAGDFTQDANVNLQVSALNTMGLKGPAQSYITYILRQVSDWETNAKHSYGIENAIMGSPRTDGDGNGLLYHTLAGYPFIYWNTGADWLLIPIYEYWQCYGNEIIPVGEDVDLDELTSVLDLTDEDKARISADGFNLEDDILAPLLTKLYNFWIGYTDSRFYISADGTEMHLNDGTTMGENDRFMFTPGYSPENGSPVLAANTSMDIGAAHDSMEMVREFVEQGIITDISADDVDSFESKIPEYLYGEDGALKEWAIRDYAENYNHRHVSHTYGAWPAYAAQNDAELSEGIGTALNMRYYFNVSDNAQAHGHLHNALVEARIKRVQEYQKELWTLVGSDYEYATLMTSHNKGHISAFCTDNAFGLNGVVTEGFIYSDNTTIEILPTLLDEFSAGGRITHLMSRTGAEVEEITWNSNKADATITAVKDKTIKLMCGEAWDSVTINGTAAEIKLDDNNRNYTEVTLKAGETINVSFTLKELGNGTYYIKTSNGYLDVESYSEGAKTATGDAEEWNLTWLGNGTYKIVNTASGRVLTDTGIVRDSDYVWSEAELAGFTFEQQSTKSAGCVADTIEINTSYDVSEGIKAGKTAKFEATKFEPGLSVSNGVLWKVEATDGTAFISTKIADGLLVVGADAVGKTLHVYATSPDGSCKSNVIEIVVDNMQIITEKEEFENIEYGFGSYKMEDDNGILNIGSVNGKSLFKFSDVDFDNLLSVSVFKNKTSPSRITLYYDLNESESKTYASETDRRYPIDDVSVDDNKRISDTVSAADGVAEINIGLSKSIHGIHDLYVQVESNGSVWYGNYDYMELVYEDAPIGVRTEFEAYTYGYSTSGPFKIDTRTDSNYAGNCSGGARVHNVGVGGTQYFTFEDVDFNGALGMIINCRANGSIPIEVYADYKDADGLVISNTDEVPPNTNSADSPKLASAAPDLSGAKLIATLTTYSADYADAQVNMTENWIDSGVHDICIVIRGSGWKGEYDYFEIMKPKQKN